MIITIEEIDKQLAQAQNEHGQALAQVEEFTRICLRAEGAIIQLRALRGMLMSSDMNEANHDAEARANDAALRAVK